MNKTLTSKKAILTVSKEVVIKSGLQSLNIRDVAKKCGISIGSVYNYFPSKSDLIVETTESIWIEIMSGIKAYRCALDFAENIRLLFDCIQIGCQKYPAFFSVHSMSIANYNKNKGRKAMALYFKHIKNNLLKTLNDDPKVRKDAFSDEFTQLDFLDFIFSNFISTLIKREKSCDFLLEIVKRAIY